jgi:hypothetical protein
VTPAENNDLDGRAGLDLKLGLGRGLTGDITVNTDFAQVEEDEAQVNLTRFDLFLPEKRDFFLEGQGVFAFGGVPVNRMRGMEGPPVAPILFFSRRIGLVEESMVPILAGGRVTGKVDAWSIGALQIRQDRSDALDLPATDFTAVRVRRDILTRSSIGVIYTRRSPFEGGDGVNQVGGADLYFAPTQELTFNTYVAKSDTPGKRGDDLSYRGLMNYQADLYGLQLEHLVVDTNFDPQVGLLRREDFQRSYAQGRFSRRPSDSAIRRWSLTGAFDYITDNDRVLESRQESAGLGFELVNGDDAEVGIERSLEILDEPFEISDGRVIPPGTYRFLLGRGSYELGARHRVMGRIGAGGGSFYGGTLREAFYQGRVEVTSALSVEPNVSVNHIDQPVTGPFWVSVFGLRTTWTLSPRAVVGALLQYSDADNAVSASARLRWEYRPGSDLFVVYTEGRDTLESASTRLQGRTFAVKLTRLLRF